MSDRRRQLRIPRRGTILIVAMIIIFALVSLALVLGRSMRVEAAVSANESAAGQAAAIARGAEQYVLAMLAAGEGVTLDADQRLFQAVPVGDGYFWIIRPDYGDPTLPRFGLVDESAKVHLNAVSLERLQRMPGMTDEIAAAIIDWRDEDDEVTPGGAESQYYMSLPEPYRAKNAPFETVDELLMVRGMTRDLLYGQSASGAARTAARPLGSDLYHHDGLYDYFTVRNSVPNTSTDGSRRINVNSQDQRSNLRRLLRRRLGDERGSEVIQRLSNRSYSDIFNFAWWVGLDVAELELIEDHITVGNQRRLRGRINVNAAPREVLLTLGLSEADVDALISARAGAAAANPRSIAWVLEVIRPDVVRDEGNEAVNALGNRIIGQGGQFSADIVAVSGDGRAFSRVRIIITTTVSPARIVYRRDLTDQGWPLDPAILSSLRRGEALAAW